MGGSERHEFSFYCQQLPLQEGPFNLAESELVKRITKILRLSSGDSILLFTRERHARYTLTSVTENAVSGMLTNLQLNRIYQPSITLLLPLLKREALEAAVYGAVECGVTTIQLIMTQKVQRRWTGLKEYERLQRVIVAAAEQSKCFAFASLAQPISLADALNNYRDVQLFWADGSGEALDPASSDCAVLVGPEGDLTIDEKALVRTHKEVQVFSLTPTVLRAQQAAVLSIGLMRSLKQPS